MINKGKPKKEIGSGFDETFKNSNVQDTLSTIMSGNKDEFRSIKLDKLNPYWNHKYKPLNQEKFEGLCEDIKRQGQLEPLIVVLKNKQYFILAGHNRYNALKHNYEEDENAPDTALCRVFTKLTDIECELIVQSTNLNRRSFDDMTLREKCENIDSYYSVVKEWYKEHKNEIVGKFETRDEVGNRLGMNYKTVEMYRKIYNAFKENVEWYELSPDMFDFTTAFYLTKFTNKDNLDAVMELLQSFKDNGKILKISVATAKKLVDKEKDNLSPKELAQTLIKKDEGEVEEVFKVNSFNFNNNVHGFNKYKNLNKEDNDYLVFAITWFLDQIGVQLDSGKDIKESLEVLRNKVAN